MPVQYPNVAWRTSKTMISISISEKYGISSVQVFLFRLQGWAQVHAIQSAHALIVQIQIQYVYGTCSHMVKPPFNVHGKNCPSIPAYAKALHSMTIHDSMMFIHFLDMFKKLSGKLPRQHYSGFGACFEGICRHKFSWPELTTIFIQYDCIPLDPRKSVSMLMI